MKIKSIVMVGGGIQQKNAILDLQKNGFSVIVTDQNIDSPGMKIANHTIHTSATDVKKISTWILKEKKRLNIKGIFTLTNFAYETSLIAETCDLPHLDPKIVLQCDDKLLMKKLFKKFNFPTSDFAEIKTKKELDESLKRFGFPSFLKISDSFGGKGIFEINSFSDGKKYWSMINKIPSSGSIIIEKKLTGEFIDVQGFIHNNKFFQAGDLSSWFTDHIDGIGKTNPIETLNICPTQLPANVIEDAYCLLFDIGKKLGFTWGPIGGDFILTENGLKIIEISPRLHGPNANSWLFPYSKGTNPFLFFAQMVCGESLDLKLLKPKFKKFVACRVFPGFSGVVSKIKIPSHKNLIGKNIYAKKNESYNLGPTFSGACTVYLRTDSLSELYKSINIIDKKIQFIK